MGFFRLSRAANSTVPDWILRNFESIPDFIVLLITCKNEEDRIKNGGAIVLTIFPHCNPIGAICCHDTQSSDWIWPKTQSSLSLTPIVLKMNFDYDRPAGLRDIHV